MEENKSKREILIDLILQKTNKYNREQIEEILDIKEKQIVNLVLSQTNMTEEDAKQQLEENDYNSIKVIKKHFGIKEKEVDNNVNVNQQVYKEIRYFMDSASKQYRYTKELEKRKEEFLEFLKTREANEPDKKLLTITEEKTEDIVED
tara:strand:+ start:482 stop:925 length:444 start_codon:yes stop_codon:yes gene_type:complete